MTPSRYPLALACACLTLSACSSVRSDAEAAVRDSLKDPDSARFGEFYHNEQTGKACLTVNARNSMGGYTGDKQAFLIKTKDGWRAGGEAEAGPDICREMFADKADDAD